MEKQRLPDQPARNKNYYQNLQKSILRKLMDVMLYFLNLLFLRCFPYFSVQRGGFHTTTLETLIRYFRLNELFLEGFGEHF